jgi:hypothetical protein
MNYFDSDMSKSTNTVVYFDWKTVIYIYASIVDSNMTSFFRFINKRAIYRLGIISLAHALVHVTDFPVVKVFHPEPEARDQIY